MEDLTILAARAALLRAGLEKGAISLEPAKNLARSVFGGILKSPRSLGEAAYAKTLAKTQPAIDAAAEEVSRLSPMLQRAKQTAGEVGMRSPGARLDSTPEWAALRGQEMRADNAVRDLDMARLGQRRSAGHDAAGAAGKQLLRQGAGLGVLGTGGLLGVNLLAGKKKPPQAAAVTNEIAPGIEEPEAPAEPQSTDLRTRNVSNLLGKVRSGVGGWWNDLRAKYRPGGA